MSYYQQDTPDYHPHVYAMLFKARERHPNESNLAIHYIALNSLYRQKQAATEDVGRGARDAIRNAGQGDFGDFMRDTFGATLDMMQSASLNIAINQLQEKIDEMERFG